MERRLTNENFQQYEKDGYVILKNYFSSEEMELLQKAYEQDNVLKQAAYDRGDSEGLKTRLTLWYGSEDNIYSAFMRSERILTGVQKMLNGPVALYHTKFMQKDPRVGGAWEWHQDYGYWYKNGFLLPQMLSVMVAVSEANKENGCLQVIKGSHVLGRIEHLFSGEQVGADMDRVNACLERMELVYVELEPGDVLFFHSNLLHRSDANLSEKPRLTLIAAYNLASNKPYKKEPDSAHLPVESLPDDSILKMGIRVIEEQADFLTPSRDAALK